MRRALLILLSGLALCVACSDPAPPAPPEEDAPQDLPADASDSAPDLPDPPDEVADALPELPSPCPDAPPCARGYAFNAVCECEAPLNRSCASDADCRAQETCERFNQTGVCMLDPATLAVRACPGGPDCSPARSGGLEAAAVSKIVTPRGFETVKPEGLTDGNQLNFNPPASPELWNDCGLDGLCPEDDGYLGPDEGEGDGVLQGVWLAGFGHGRPAQYCPDALIGCDGPECCVSKLAHDDILVQIAVVRQGGVTVAFAALDTVGLFRDEIEAIREALPPEAGVDLLVMAATHNHEGPDSAGQWGPGTLAPASTGKDPRWMRFVREQTVAGIVEAVAALRPAQARVAILNVGVDGLAIADSRPPYIFDDNVPVIHLVGSEDGQSIATMFSFANHAEALWSRNPYISSDLFHFARKYVRQGLPAVLDAQGQELKPALAGLGGVPVMFAGAVGGLINPGRGGAKTYAGEPVDEVGYALADAVGQTLASRILEASARGELVALDAPTLSFAHRPFLTPISNRVFQLAAFLLKLFHRDIYNAAGRGVAAFVPGDPQTMSEVAAVRLGDVTIFTAPGEVFPELLVGGYPGKYSVQSPVIGDVEGRRAPPTCDAQGLPTPQDDGDQPCIVRGDQENPPDFSRAPDGPYGYERVGAQQRPFFIGLGQDFLGYMVPPYDYQYRPSGEVPGSHYEETNGASGELVTQWLTHLQAVLDALP